MNTSKGMYGGLGAAAVVRCYIYVQLHSPHLCIFYTQTCKIKIWPIQSCCHNRLTARLVSVLPSSMKSKIPVLVLEFLSICKNNRKPAGKPIRKYQPTTIKRKRNLAFSGKDVCQTCTHYAENNQRFQMQKASANSKIFHRVIFHLIETDSSLDSQVIFQSTYAQPEACTMGPGL